MAKKYIESKAAYNAIVQNYTTDDQLRDLDAIPAADVVEVRHGRWKGAGFGDYDCSICNETYSIGAERVKNWHYCPNCMAKMDGGQDDD